MSDRTLRSYSHLLRLTRYINRKYDFLDSIDLAGFFYITCEYDPTMLFIIFNHYLLQSILQIITLKYFKLN